MRPAPKYPRVLTILEVAKARKRSGLGTLQIQTEAASAKPDRNKRSKRHVDMPIETVAVRDGRYAERMALCHSTSDDVKRDCKQVWMRLEPIFAGLAQAHIDGSVHPTYKELSRFQDLLSYMKTRMRKTDGRPSAWNVFILRTVVMQDLELGSDECSYAMVAAAVWEAGLCNKDAWRGSRSMKTMFLTADRVAPGALLTDDGEHERASEVVRSFTSDTPVVSDDVRTTCTQLWTRLQGVFRSLAHAHIDGSVHPTFKALMRYDTILSYITTRMRKTATPSTWSVSILTLVLMQDLALKTDECSPAVVAGAVWEAGFCDHDAWRSSKNVKMMMVYAEFYGDGTKYGHAWPSPWLDTSVVPLRFKHRLAAGAAMICHATQNKNLVYICSGMDFLLPRTYTYYMALKRDFEAGRTALLSSTSVACWCRDTGFFEGGVLQQALAVDIDDQFQLQDVHFTKRRDAGESQYLWLPAVAYYLVDMEFRTKAASSLSVTPLLDVLFDASHWSIFSVLTPTEGC